MPEKKFDEFLKNQPEENIEEAHAQSVESGRVESLLMKNPEMEEEKPGIDYWKKRFDQYVLTMNNKFVFGDEIKAAKLEIAKTKTEEEAKAVVLKFETLIEEKSK